jgi:hypothetical protein
MSSPRSKYTNDFDTTIGHELKSWSSKQQAPSSIRTSLLDAAARQVKQPAKDNQSQKSNGFKRIQNWLFGTVGRPEPQRHYADLSQWLFTQAAWHSLGNDRRSVRFVC